MPFTFGIGRNMTRRYVLLITYSQCTLQYIHDKNVLYAVIPEGIYVYILKDYNNFRVWGIGGRVVVVDLRRFNVHYVFPYTFLP